MKEMENILTAIRKLRGLARKVKHEYRDREPFPYALFDDAFDAQVLEEIILEFDQAADSWHEFNTRYEKKHQQSIEEKLGPTTRQFIHNLNSGPFLDFLEELTGIEGLIPDPHLTGGGLHRIPRGGKLGVHVDFNVHKRMGVYRRINVIVYLNKNWREEYGGELELWSRKQGRCVERILPAFNRMVIFNTTSESFHGHPNPLNCPDGVHRMSLALYYYTANDSGNQKKKAHSTLFLNEKNKVRPLEKISLPRALFRHIRHLLSSEKH